MPGGSLRDRLSQLSRGELIGVVMLIGLTLAGAGLWYVRSLPRPVEVRAEEPVASASVAPTATEAVVFVDVAGWVRRPGVYEFVEGARVIDAIEAAGGARPRAQLQSLNLAAPLVDGTQVLVPKEGETPSAPAGVPGSSAAGSLINVNTASASELESLPGIGEVLAQRIVDHRTQNGPFTSVDQLMDVSGIGDAILGSIRELVTV